jgi:hypothetical protein
VATPENTFIASIHRHLPAGLYRMKNHNQYNGGIADVWYSGRRDLWVEYKFIKVPARDDTVIDLIHRTAKTDSAISALQQQWLKSRHAEGRHVGVIVGSKDGGVWYPGISWNTTYPAKDFRAQTLSRSEISLLVERACS